MLAADPRLGPIFTDSLSKVNHHSVSVSKGENAFSAESEGGKKKK